MCLKIYVSLFCHVFVSCHTCLYVKFIILFIEMFHLINNLDDLERKLKIERIEVCLNCRNVVGCGNIGKFEECFDFLENEDETFVIKKV